MTDMVRTKTVNTAGKTGTLAPSRLAALQDEDRASVKEEKEGSMSEGSEEGCESSLTSSPGFRSLSASDRPKANGSGSNKPAQTVSGRAMPDTSAWKSIGGVPPRDPKSRARSREYLKQSVSRSAIPVKTQVDGPDVCRRSPTSRRLAH